MVSKRELCITEDPFAYNEDEIDKNVIGAGFNTANDWLAYAVPAHSHTIKFNTLRVQSHSDNVSRDTIIEESTDQVAAASIYSGVYNATGSFSGAFRGWDFDNIGLMRGIMGYQVPSAIADPCGGSNGKRYELTMVPSTLAVKIVDEQAKLPDGTRGTTTIYRGVGIESFELKLAAKQYATFACQWVARKSEVYDGAINSNTEPTGDPAIFYNAVLEWTPEGFATAEPFKCSEFSLNMSRAIDKDDVMIGSQFLAGLNYNGLTNIGGNITLSASDWDKIRGMIVGSTNDTILTLDQGKQEYFGQCSAGTVLANAIPSGKFRIILHSPNGTKNVAIITCDTAKLTDMTRDAQGRQKFNKTLKWQAEINNSSKFYVDVYNPV